MTDQIRRRGDPDRLNLMSGQFLLLATFIVNLATTFGAIWTILTLGLGARDAARAGMFTINHDAPAGDSISFHRDVEAASLLAKEQLALDEMSAETISLVAADHTGSKRAGVSLNPDYIAMQAHSYGPAAGLDYAFWIDRELDELQVMGSMENVRSLRSLVGLRDGPPSSGAADLRISSNEQLELSGNLGLSVHADEVSIESGDKIGLESKEEAIEIRSAPGGLAMPNLRVHHEHLELPSSRDQENALAGDLSAALAGRGYLLCIRRSDGMVYRERGSCD